MFTFSGLIKAISFFVTLSCWAEAQVSVNVKMLRSEWVKGEALVARVMITNHSGRELLLDNVGKRSWLNMEVIDSQGKDISPVRRGLHKPARVANGQSISKDINISAQYNMHRVGRFTVLANVTLPSQPDRAFQSNRAILQLHNGAIVHRRQVGLPSDPSQLREYRVIQLTAGGKTRLYSQVYDVKRQLSRRTTYIGETINFQKPKAGLDNKTHYHILFQNSPKVYTHIEFDPDGKLMDQSKHVRTGKAVPKLVSQKDGKVFVLGGVRRDRELEAKRRQRIRKLSDRP